MKTNVIHIDFQRLKATAKAKHYSTYTIAAADGKIPAPTVLKILNGKHTPSAINLKRVCDVLEIPIDEIFITEAKTAA